MISQNIKAQILPLKWCTTIKNDLRERFATTKFSKPHINTVLMEMWEEYNLYAARIILNGSEKSPSTSPYTSKCRGG